jgi:hypothetical protein
MIKTTKTDVTSSESFRNRLKKLAQEVASIGSEEHPVSKINYVQDGPSIRISIISSQPWQFHRGRHQRRKRRTSKG